MFSEDDIFLQSDNSAFQPENEGLQPAERNVFPNKHRKTTIANLFEAYEENDKEKIKQLVEGIQAFDR